MKNHMGLAWLVPGVYHGIDFSRNVRGLRGMPRRLLLLGHKLDAGTMPLGQQMQITSLAEIIAKAGRGSMLVAMYMAAYANADKGLPIDVMAVAPADGSQVAASLVAVSLSEGSTVAAAGEVPIYVHGVRCSALVTTSDTVITVAEKLVASINAAAAARPDVQVVASIPGDAAAGEFRVECRWVGASGNDIDLRATYYDDDLLPSNVVLTIPTMSGGVGVPSLQDVTGLLVTQSTPPGPDYEEPDTLTLAEALAGYRATEIVCPWTDSPNMLAIEAELTARWGRANMQDGQCVKAVRGTVSETTAWKASRQSEQCHTLPVLADCTNPWESAAMLGANVESVAVGDPSMHYRGRPMVGYMGPRRGAGYTDDERNALLTAGMSPLEVAADGTAIVSIVRTDYTQTAQGAEDKSRAQLPWVKFMSYYRWFTLAEFALNYSAGWKLDPYASEPVPGVNIMTAPLAKDVMVGNYTKLIKAGFVSQDLQGYIDSVQTEVDAANCLVNIEDEPKMLSPYYQTGIISYPVAS